MKTNTQNQYQQAINRVEDYINSHLGEELPVTLLADLACISRFHFHRIFSSVIGGAGWNIHNTLRLETAAQLLENPDKLKTVLRFRVKP